MKKWRKLACKFVPVVILGITVAKGQTTFAIPFSISKSSPVITFSLDNAGTFVESGGPSAAESITVPAGPNFVWYPSSGAIEAGYFSGNLDTLGSGSATFGDYNSNTGTDSFAAGEGNAVSGFSSGAFGLYNTEANSYSLVVGEGTSTTCDASVAFGYNTFTSGFGELVIGQYNTGGGSSGGSNGFWVNPYETAFEIGNGYYSFFNPPYGVLLSDAFVVYKNGNAQFQGKVRCAPGGDLSMGSFTAGSNPSTGQPQPGP